MNDRWMSFGLFVGMGFGLFFVAGVCTVITAFLAWTLGFALDFGLIFLTALVCVFVNTWSAITLAPESALPQKAKAEEDADEEEDI